MGRTLFPGRQFISTVLDMLDTKDEMSSRVWQIYLMRAAMAGLIISIFYLAYHGLIAGFDAIPAGDTTLKPIGKVAGSLVFGFALVFIYYTKSELLTSNMMIGAIGRYYRRVSVPRLLKILGLCYLGNFIGGLFIALLLIGSSLADGDVGRAMSDTVEIKTGYITEGPFGWSDLFVRAILCNFLINLAMLLCYNGVITEEITKSLAMVVAVFLFAYLGLEHSVANTVLFLMVGFQEGIPVGAAVANVGIALAGNFVGGGILIGLYYAYANDYARNLKRGRVGAEDEPGKT